MKKIETLAEDIYEILDSDVDHKADSLLASEAGERIAGEMAGATKLRNKPRELGKLWASDLGKKCLRQHYYKFNEPDKGEKLSGNTKFKFLYGNLLEEAVLYYALEAGHTVTGCQDRVESEVSGWKVSGRIDAIIDDTLIDVKSTSSYGYKRYSQGINASNDSFGYLEQLGFYHHFGDWDCDDTGFVWIDKQNGHIAYTQVQVPTKQALVGKVDAIIGAVEGLEQMAPRGYALEPYGQSGNMKLPIGCSYCDFKQHCYRDSNNGKGLRGFVYNQGPVWFAEVHREPKVPEIPNG